MNSLPTQILGHLDVQGCLKIGCFKVLEHMLL